MENNENNVQYIVSTVFFQIKIFSCVLILTFISLESKDHVLWFLFFWGRNSAALPGTWSSLCVI